MKYPGVLWFFLLLALALFGSAPAQAQNDRSWVASNGLDGNPCTRSQPCGTFAQALTQTNNGGSINCVDAVEIGPMTITRSVTISCEGNGGLGGIVINAGSSDTVVLHGLKLDGRDEAFYDYGVQLNSGAFLHIDHCLIRGFTNAGIGIFTAGPHGSIPKFLVSNSQIIRNAVATGGEGGGILIKPTTSGTVMGVVTNSVIDHNLYGIIADGQAGVSAILLTVENTTIAASINHGLVVGTESAPVWVKVKNSTISYNGNIGINSQGAGALVKVAGSSITANATGVSGNVQSYLNNDVSDNGSNGRWRPFRAG